MNIIIKQGELKHKQDCIEAVLHSKIGQCYFNHDHRLERIISKGLEHQEVIVATDEHDHCLGFIMGSSNGMFKNYPYIHLVAVKELYQHKGIGTKLLNAFEEQLFQHANKLFLVVADFNNEIKTMYQKLGYLEVGIIPNLYKEGISEHLMMKVK